MLLYVILGSTLLEKYMCNRQQKYAPDTAKMARERIPPKNVDLLFFFPTKNTNGFENRSKSSTVDLIFFLVKQLLQFNNPFVTLFQVLKIIIIFLFINQFWRFRRVIETIELYEKNDAFKLSTTFCVCICLHVFFPLNFSFDFYLLLNSQ